MKAEAGMALYLALRVVFAIPVENHTLWGQPEKELWGLSWKQQGTALSSCSPGRRRLLFRR